MEFNSWILLCKKKIQKRVSAARKKHNELATISNIVIWTLIGALVIFNQSCVVRQIERSWSALAEKKKILWEKNLENLLLS